MNPVSRRELSEAALMAGAAVAAESAGAVGPAARPERIRTGIIGCGSVSNSYLPDLLKCPHVEIVSLCDIRPERARRQAERYGVRHHYPHIDAMLAGEPFDFLVNLTDMQEHEHLNRQALEAGKHVWSEKPIANTLAEGQRLLALARRKGVRLWGAPIVVQSRQFAFMARVLAEGRLGRVAAALGSYGHLGPDWARFFYTRGGGSLPDLGVYNLTFMTGLLGPARAVTALTTIVTPKRRIRDVGEIAVTEEDNAMVLLDHGNGVISHVDSSFNYFNPRDHDYTGQDHHTITIIGREGQMKLAGYDWGPHGVDLSTASEPAWKRYEEGPQGYLWQQGASLAAEVLATGKELLLATPEHALHVVEIITAARESSATGRRIPLKSTFKWPVVG